MLRVNRTQVATALKTVGIKHGDGVMIHSSTQFLGIPDGGIGMYYEVIDEMLGLQSNEGTLVVPTFTFGFAHGETFDQSQSPSDQMGAFSEYVRLLPDSRRSMHPMHSVAVVGRYSEELTRIDTLGAFDPGSVFERMVDLDFKLLLLGADVYYTTMIHYCERRAKVPYRYWKNIHGEVRLTAQPPVKRTYRMFARDLDLNPDVNATPVKVELEKRGQWFSIDLNYGKIASCRFQNFVAAAEDLLARDPWVLVVNRPEKTIIT